jgi:hypothetical protein
MTPREYLEKYGEPQGWGLALAIQEQVEDFQRIAAIVAKGQVPPVPDHLNLLFQVSDADTIEWCEERVRKPVIDLRKAKERGEEIEQRGGGARAGWAGFVGLTPISTEELIEVLKQERTEEKR